MRLAPLLCAAALLLLAHGGNSSVAEAGGAARSMVEREFQFTPGAFRLVPRGGQTLVEVRGGVPEDRPGYPDLPSVTERVDLPAGQRVADLEVVSLETALLADAVRLPAAFDLRPGRPTPERTAPDPGAFTRRGFQPAIPARLGVQGTQRERNLAAIQVWPVRWDAASGRLERVVRLRLRIWLEPGGPVPLKRERIIPEWEGTPAGRRSPAVVTTGA